MERYHIQNEKRILSPALVYYKDIITRNLEQAITEAGGAKHLWPHVKSHKMEEVIKLQVMMGIKRFKCATIKEAETAAMAGGEHILLAYPLIGPGQERFLELIKQWKDRTFYVLGDDLWQLKKLAGQAKIQKVTMKVFVDVNTGMDRTGVEIDRLQEFCKELVLIEGLQLAGFHCYDGNRHEKELQERKEKVKETIKEMQKALESLECSQRKEEISFIFGGSPTFPCYAEQMKGQNIFYSPGTVFIYDVGYQVQFPDLPYEPAAAVLTRVVSHPKKGYFTIDCGYKAISAEQGCPGILSGVPYARSEFQSEEHWTFSMEKGHEEERPDIGEILYVLPWHICPTTALYDEAVIADHRKIEGIWKVSARKHLAEILMKDR